ncbi:MAG TPA: STAS domain-containing protein [Acidimicrobiales bacterium]|jgi:anti-sigma B factor antagonist|nr:STAS domain-containing protein [Acidimicrobiales bacterium]
MEKFGIEASRSNGTAVVAVRGEVDLYTAPQVWETIDKAIAGAPEELVIDLSDVTFLDSSGLSVLVRAHKRLRPVQRTVVVRGANDQVYMALEMTRLTKVLSVEAAAPTN